MKRKTDLKTLTGAQLAQALAALGWKQTDFCRRTGLSTVTVSRWATGQTAIPPWVGEYLGVLQELASLHARFVKPAKASKVQEGEGDTAHP